ncbi:MAG: Druantia anti-phage system protein DruA [Nitrospiraceae bacterium]
MGPGAALAASRRLGLAARRLAADFQARYAYRPLLLETFVEAARFTGTCYRAANWIRVGQTTGRGRNDRRSWQPQQTEAAPLPVKSIGLYPLRSDCRTRLCTLGGEAGACAPSA